ncbi:hypothetical protein ACX8XP_04425 [Calditrichota bacterium LG25]
MLKLNNMDLVLLVGTNPLPNYITAKYYSLKYGVNRIWLVHSLKTEKQMKNLSNIIQKQFKIEIEPVSIRDEGDALSIEEDIKGQILHGFQGNHLHLNYTGGTKAMGIHVYRAIEQHKSTKDRCSFSYLSASKFQLMEDNKNFITGDLRKEIDLDFHTLFALHGYKKINPDSGFGQDGFKNSTSIFKEFIEKENLDEYYTEFQSSSLKRKLKDILGSYKQRKSLQIENIPPIQVEESLLSRIMAALPERIISQSGKPQIISNEANFVECAEYIAKHKWFEDYVCQTLRVQLNKIRHIKIDKNWEFQGDGWGQNTFEIDVLMLNGYQFIGISCTTLGYVYKKDIRNKDAIYKDKSGIKEKGFEIILRTRQIGGDESRAILVTMAEPQLVRTVEQELQLETGNTANILVLGKKDLKEAQLVRKIRDFINLKD